jgi:hypoxanthine-DNA glycosylase
LILGTLPGTESIRAQQYYAQPRNIFWQVITSVFGPADDYQGCIRLLKQNRIALWDVLKEAEREGSTDKKIVRGSEVPNQIEDFLLKNADIEHVLFNGRKAETYFKRFLLQKLPRVIRTDYLPSTSSANTLSTCERKVQLWSETLAAALNSEPLPADKSRIFPKEHRCAE